MKLNYHHLNFSYTKHPSVNGCICFYCGNYADTIDHCPPVSLLNFYPDYDRVVVKACASCNAILGHKFLPTLLSRVENLIACYRKKYRKYLTLPEWSQEEIQALRGSLKIYVENEIIKVETSKMRIECLLTRQNELRELL